MRFWHQSLIPYLDRERLLGQHRECCALRGNGWGKKHATVDYVFEHRPVMLYNYHIKVIKEMEKRGYRPNLCWLECSYRGLSDAPSFTDKENDVRLYWIALNNAGVVYPEHDEAYLKECVALLKQKNAPIDFERLEKELNIKGEK